MFKLEGLGPQTGMGKMSVQVQASVEFFKSLLPTPCFVCRGPVRVWALEQAQGS